MARSSATTAAELGKGRSGEPGGRGIEIEPARLLTYCVGQAVAGKADRYHRVTGEGKQRDIAAEGDQAAEGFQGQKGIERTAFGLVDALLVPGEVGKDMPAQRMRQHRQRGVGSPLGAQGQ